MTYPAYAFFASDYLDTNEVCALCQSIIHTSLVCVVALDAPTNLQPICENCYEGLDAS